MPAHRIWIRNPLALFTANDDQARGGLVKVTPEKVLGWATRVRRACWAVRTLANWRSASRLTSPCSSSMN